MSWLSLRSSEWSDVKEQIERGTRGSLFLARFSERSAGAEISLGLIDVNLLLDRSRDKRQGDHSTDSGSSLSLLHDRLSSSKFGSLSKLCGMVVRRLFCRLILTTFRECVCVFKRVNCVRGLLC